MSNHLHCIALPCSAQHHSFFLSASDDKRANLNEYQKAFLSVAHPAHTSPGAKQLTGCATNKQSNLTTSD
jgi:hypothetical protein